MNVWQCDRCGIVMKGPEIQLSTKKYDPMGLCYSAIKIKLDLCDKCYSKFENFLNQEKPYDN